MPHRELSIYESLLRRVLNDFIEEGMSKSAVFHVAEDVCSTTPPPSPQEVAAGSTNNFITPLTDEEATELLISNGRSEDDAKAHVRACRNLAESMNYHVIIFYKVKAGFTFKKYAPQLGYCYKDWEYLQDWKLQGDEPVTKDSLVFWIPRLVPGSTNKSVSDQLNLLAELRKEHNLPESYLASFGDVSLLSGLILSHRNSQADERVPLNHLWARTDTIHAHGDRLELGGFGGYGHGCGSWYWDGDRNFDLGCFALGVELLNPRNPDS